MASSSLEGVDSRVGEEEKRRRDEEERREGGEEEGGREGEHSSSEISGLGGREACEQNVSRREGERTNKCDEAEVAHDVHKVKHGVDIEDNSNANDDFNCGDSVHLHDSLELLHGVEDLPPLHPQPPLQGQEQGQEG